MENSQRFVDAYNKTDKALHARFGLKPSLPFSDAVRRAAALNTVVRKFQDDLIDYGRLRNAIVHRSNSAMTIAEPHDDVTEHFEHIAEVLASPPLASSIARKPATLAPDEKLSKAIATMSKLDYSIMPVVDKNGITGILTNKCVVGFLAKHLDGADEALKSATVADALSDGRTYFCIMRDCPVDDVLQAFEKNRKLSMVIVTSDGTEKGSIVGIVSVGDLVSVTKMLESF